MVLTPYSMTNYAMAGYARRLSQPDKADVEVILDQHDSKSHTYTTLESLSGHVKVTTSQRSPFDEILLTLEGQARANLTPMTPVGHHTVLDATYTFLRLRMPIAESAYPEPRVAEPGKTYEFPFTFVIPDRLLPTSCPHEVKGDHVHEAHLNLPPSLGEIGFWGTDDLSPEMSKIIYTIRARIIEYRLEERKARILTSGERRIHVIPSIVEAPPLHISAEDKDYNLSATKSIRKGIFKGKLGQITVTAEQTQSLSASSSPHSSNPTTMATLKLRFEPADDTAQPPRLGSLSTKIRAWTFHSIKALKDLPTHASGFGSFEANRGVYSTSVSLASRSVESVSWTYVAPVPLYARRDSGYSTASISSSSSTSLSETTITHESAANPCTTRLGTYEATLIVPLTLPSNKRWLPTFHCCLISRIYSLFIDLSVHGPGKGMLPSTLSLRLPVQISTAGEAGVQEVAVESELDEILRPRRMTAPDLGAEIAAAGEAQEQSDLPPGYNLYARRATVIGVHGS